MLGQEDPAQLQSFVLVILEVLRDEAGSLPFPASLGVGQGHAEMRLLQTSSCRQHRKQQTLDCALHPIVSSVSFQGGDSLRQLGDLPR